MARRLNGVAHTIFTVSDMKRSAPFYRAIGSFFDMKCVMDNDNFLYYVGGRTAIGISPGHDKNDRFVQSRVGLHHVCWRMYDRKGVDDFYDFARTDLVPLAGTIVQEAQEGVFAPGYYSALIEDPDGIRLEVNHVPGPGLLGMDKPRVQGYGEDSRDCEG